MRFDLHVHSKHSRDASASPEEIVKRCRITDLDGLAVTDHNSIDGSLRAHDLARSEQVIVVRGVEVSSQEGHVLALGVRELVPRGLPAAETIERIHALGGIAIAAHPGRFPSGMELELARDGGFDAIEVINGASSGRSNRLARKVAELKGSAVTGGSDAHDLDHIGRAFTVVDGVASEDDLLQVISKGKARAGGGSRTYAEGARYPIELLAEWMRAGFKRL